MWKWILRMWDNGRKNIKLDRAECMDMGSLSRASAFNAEVQGVRKDSNRGWLVGQPKHGPKSGHHKRTGNVDLP